MKETKKNTNQRCRGGAELARRTNSIEVPAPEIGGERMSSLFKRLWNDESGVSATEYAIIAAIIGVALIGTLVAFRGSMETMFKRASTAVSTGN